VRSAIGSASTAASAAASDNGNVAERLGIRRAQELAQRHAQQVARKELGQLRPNEQCVALAAVALDAQRNGLVERHVVALLLARRSRDGREARQRRGRVDARDVAPPQRCIDPLQHLVGAGRTNSASTTSTTSTNTATCDSSGIGGSGRRAAYMSVRGVVGGVRLSLHIDHRGRSRFDMELNTFAINRLRTR